MAWELRTACPTGSFSLGPSGHLFVHLCAPLQEEVQPFQNDFWTVFMFFQRQTLLETVTTWQIFVSVPRKLQLILMANQTPSMRVTLV